MCCTIVADTLTDAATDDGASPGQQVSGGRRARMDTGPESQDQRPSCKPATCRGHCRHWEDMLLGFCFVNSSELPRSWMSSWLD